jgi:hypothetical protein
VIDPARMPLMDSVGRVPGSGHYPCNTNLF